MNLDPQLLRSLADKVGTPFWLYDASTIRQRIADVQFMTKAPQVQARFAMKACPATRVLREMKGAGIWIDAVSGNEALRARRAGFAGGHTPPEICFTADVFRDNALEVVLTEGLLPNIGSPGMVRELAGGGVSRAGFAADQSGLRTRACECVRYGGAVEQAWHLGSGFARGEGCGGGGGDAGDDAACAHRERAAVSGIAGEPDAAGAGV